MPSEGRVQSMAAHPDVVFEDPIKYAGHEGHLIGVWFDECVAHPEPQEPEAEDDPAWDDYEERLEAWQDEHVPLGDGDLYGCADTLVGDYCRTCFEAEDDPSDEPTILTAPARVRASGELSDPGETMR